MIINPKISYVLHIKDIFSWYEPQNSNIKINEESIIVELPILQRGLVWSQNQIELLWDSLLRGIPIGSFVICRKTSNYQSRNSFVSTHYLLDGQQRSDAIKLGFSVFPAERNKQEIIWIDLETDSKNFPNNSTREFLIRLTTPAHPWGFDKSDLSGKLDSRQIREGFPKNMSISDFANYNRPLPCDIYPFASKIPIPLSILLSAKTTGINDFWEDVLFKLGSYTYTWANKAVDFINSNIINKEKIYDAIVRVLKTKIVALDVPNNLLEQSNNERNNSSQVEIKGVTNIEQIFHRLNTQGTDLEGEELIYSMIKTYLPEIADTVDRVAEGRMPPSRLVNLGVRVALSDQNSMKNPYSVNQIRKIVKDDLEANLKIKSFINQELEGIMGIIDSWLTNDDNTWGLPRILKTSISIKSPDVYFLLMILARKFHNANNEIYKRITGMTLLIHWFVDPENRNRIVSKLYFKVINIIKVNDLIPAFKQTISENINLINRFHFPYLFKELVEFDSIPDKFKNWRWEKCKDLFYEKFYNGKDSSFYDDSISPWLYNLIHNREILLYSQREYLREKFADYDPARKDLWKDYNRPWDFDHILPRIYIKGRWSGTYNDSGWTANFKDFCNQWINTIGNLRAWPFEDNRSDHDTPTLKKMKVDEYWDKSCIAEDERSGYSDRGVLYESNKAFNFGFSCKTRIFRLYLNWFEGFYIEDLFEKSPLEYFLSVNKEIS